MNRFTMKMKGIFFALGALCLFTLAGCSNEGDPNEISVSKHLLTFDKSADFAYVTLETNAEWEAVVEIDEDDAPGWCRVGTTTGHFSQQVQIFVDDNDTDRTRSARVYFRTSKSKKMSTAILVSQSPEAAGELN